MHDGDDELLALYHQGEVDAFDALFDRHHGAVFNFARLMLGDAGEAEVPLSGGVVRPPVPHIKKARPGLGGSRPG